MADLESYEVVDKFTQCAKCKQVLTEKDKGHVYDIEEIQSNPGDFAQEYVQELRKNRYTKVLWICAFCSHNNIISNVDIRFAKNRTRVIEREKMAEKKDPIMLIVFDVSGSMEESVDESSEKGSQEKKSSWPHLDKIKQTKIYKKIVAQQQHQLEELMKSHNPNGCSKQKTKYVDHLKKNKLLMGLTEYLINKINPMKKQTTTAQQNKKIHDFCKDTSKTKNLKDSKNKTVGFMFFNSNLMLSLDGNDKNDKGKKVMLVDSSDEYKPKYEGFERQIVDFDSFEGLFKAGQKYADGYTNKITNFDFDQIDFKSMSNYTQGQTALGPAIVTALGVVSKHGQGSSIVVVTDGIGNKGIFDQTEAWDEGYKLLKIRLQKMKCFMTVLQFRKHQDKNKMKEEQSLTGLDKFCQRHNDSVVKKINVILNENQNKNNQYATNSLDEIQKKMKAGIDRDNCKFANEVFLKCQHPCITYNKITQQLQGKLFNLKQTIHLTPQFQQKKLQAKDYLHHFMTQIVIRYQNTESGEQSVFMSYIIQKFIKYSKMKPKDLKALDNQNTFMNVIQYLHNEEEKLNLDNLPLGLVRETFRKTLCMTNVAQRTFRVPTKQYVEDQPTYEWIENMKKFQNQAMVGNYTYKKPSIEPNVKKAVQKQKKPQTKSVFGQSKSIQKALPLKIQEKVQQKISVENQEDDQEQYISL